MPNEPSALPEILAGLPDAADYDAVHAALTATEAGRRFLAEFAARNRNADTTMVVAAIARVEAAIRGEGAPAPPVRAGELVEIAAASDGIRTALAAGATQAAKLAAASERLQDLAFTLHERAVEAPLLDALDAAVAELAAAAAASDGGAVALLHALASRVAEMIGERGAAPPAAGAEELPPPADLFATAANDGDAFVQAVASLAAAAAAPAAEESVPLPAPPAEAVAAEVPPADASEEPPVAGPASGQGAAPTIETAEPAAVASDTTMAAADSDTVAAPAQPEALEASGSEAILSQAFADDFFVVKESSAPEPMPALDLERTDEPPEPAPSEAILPAHDFTAGPEEDPGELFEPPPPNPEPSAVAEESAAEATATEATAAADAPAPAATSPEPEEPAEPPQPARVVPPPPLRAIPRPPLSDPLAAVRDLSDEERIALFS